MDDLTVEGLPHETALLRSPRGQQTGMVDRGRVRDPSGFRTVVYFSSNNGQDDTVDPGT